MLFASILKVCIYIAGDSFSPVLALYTYLMLCWQNVVYFILDGSTVYEGGQVYFIGWNHFRSVTSCIPYPNIPVLFHAYMTNLMLFTHIAFYDVLIPLSQYRQNIYME